MDRIKSFAKALRGLVGPTKSLSSPVSSLAGRLRPQTEQQLIHDYTGWVYVAVNTIAENVGTVDFQLKEMVDGDYSVIDDHPLLDLLNNPNPMMSGQDLFTITSQQRNLLGNAFWWMEAPDVLAEPTALIPLSAARMTIDTTGDYPVYKYRSMKGTERVFSYFEIIHFKNLNPFDEDRGKSPLSALQGIIASEERAMDFHLSMFDNRAVPSGVLTYKGSMTPQRSKKLEEAWEKYQGTKAAGSTLILGEGTEWQATGGSSADAELLATRMFNRDAVFAHYRLPPSVVGIKDTSNFATAKANDFTFQSRVIKPEMRQMANAIGHKLIERYREISNLKLDFKDPVPRDDNFELAKWTAGVDKWMTTNEVREQNGLEPIGSEGDVLFRNTGQISLEDATYLPSSTEAETGEVGASVAGQAEEE